MPNKYPNKKGWNVPKLMHKPTNWSEYNEALKRRSNILVWLSDEAISQWYESDRVYDGSGTPRLFTDFAIITCHEIRQVYRLPLRQIEGFINSLFEMLIIFYNMSLLSKLLQAHKDNEAAVEYLTSISPVASQHLNISGLYEFSEEPSDINIDAMVSEMEKLLAEALLKKSA